MTNLLKVANSSVIENPVVKQLKESVVQIAGVLVLAVRLQS